MIYRIVRWTIIPLCKSLFNVTAEGKNKIPKNTPFILASNHISNLDPVVLGSVVAPCELAYLAKEELFRNKLFAFLIKGVGAIPLKRGDKDIRAIRLALKILKEKPLLIFPQGSRGEELDNFRAGVGFLYKKTHLPIIAARIYGTDRILPKGAKFIHIGKVKVVFDEVKDIRDNDTYEEITARVINRIKSM